MPIGLTVPFTQSTGSLGVLAFTDDEVEAAKQNIKSLLVTNWGDRPMHFHLGCNFVEFLFEPLKNDVLRQKMSDRVVDQLQKWLPFVRLQDLVITFHEDDSRVPANGVGVAMKFFLVSKPTNVASLFQVVPGPGGG
jgi:phage baseplate assembly protein W